MILYLDTSSLIKLYVAESASPQIKRLVAEASLVCTSVVAYAEARSALARLCRQADLTLEEHDQAKTDLEGDWPNYLALDVSQEIWRRAGDLAESMPSVDSTAFTSRRTSTWPAWVLVSPSSSPPSTIA